MLNPDSSHHSDILVVGGGVIGLACAYYLIRSGHSVRINKTPWVLGAPTETAD